MKANKPLLLGILTSLCLVSCVKESLPEVAIFIYDSQDTFMLSLQESIQRELSGKFASSLSYAERNQVQQTLAAIAAIDGGADALVINLVDRLSAGALIEKAYQEEVPIVFANRKPLTSDLDPEKKSDYASWVKENCFYVGSYPLYEGATQSEIVDSFFEGPDGFASSPYDKNGDGIVQVAVMKGEQGHQDAEERTMACLQTLEELGYSYQLVATAYGNWERTAAFAETSKFPLDEIELLYSNNDDMALGVIDFLKTLLPGGNGFISKSFFPIVGVDATPAGRAAVDDGNMIGTVINDAAIQSEWIGYLLSELLLGDELPPVTANVVREGNYFYVEGGIYSSF